MANIYGVPGIDVQQLAQMRSNGDQFVLMDVREVQELNLANLGDGVKVVPLSYIAQRYEQALPEEIRDNKAGKIVVMCHTGVRSAQVTQWMRSNGYDNVWNLDGGIEAYAVEVDRSVGRY
jgi:rhodanese-related sulfurtransferase